MKINNITIYIICFFYIVSCSNSRVKNYKQRFFSSYISLPILPNPTFDEYNQIEINMADTAKTYINLLIKEEPKNIENYLWKAKTYFMLEDFDSMIYTLNHLPSLSNMKYEYAIHSLTGIGFEFKGNIDEANRFYEKSLHAISKNKDEIPLDYAFSKFLLSNDKETFKNDLINSLIEYNKKVPNEEILKIYLNEFENIPFEHKRKDIIYYILQRPDNLFFEIPE